MPRISQFYGMSIYMYYQDHAPPHFHAIYGEFEAVIDIRDSSLVEGELPKRALKLVTEWARLHRAELLENWRLARASEPLEKVEPLQ